ncbi:hypothetical protein NEAUS03_1977 [Nematocida ausubeli]|nr:hypothetical protein NEAUS03_1977 [Nematocida ausubeli]
MNSIEAEKTVLQKKNYMELKNIWEDIKKYADGEEYSKILLCGKIIRNIGRMAILLFSVEITLLIMVSAVLNPAPMYKILAQKVIRLITSILGLGLLLDAEKYFYSLAYGGNSQEMDSLFKKAMAFLLGSSFVVTNLVKTVIVYPIGLYILKNQTSAPILYTLTGNITLFFIFTELIRLPNARAYFTAGNTFWDKITFFVKCVYIFTILAILCSIVGLAGIYTFKYIAQSFSLFITSPHLSL